MATTMKLIAKQTLGSDTASVSFSSIPGSPYTDLLLQISARSTRSGAGVATDTLTIGFNSSTSNFSRRALYGGGSTGVGSLSTSTNLVTELPSANSTASTFSNDAIYIPNYAGSTNKSFSSEGAEESNQGEAYIVIGAHLWSNTAAITSIELATANSQNFKSGSSFYLYGITKA